MINEIIRLTEALIRFQTIHSKPEEIQRCAAFIEAYLSQNDLSFERMDHDGFPSIWVLPKNRSAVILLMSHIDVVDGPEEMFTPKLQDGKLFGRGSIDDKYAVALSLELMRRHVMELKRRGLDQKHASMGILITGDEEIGGQAGAKKALEHIRADFCIALDGGNVGEIVVKEKGMLTLKLTSKGKTAHGSRPWLGENAIEKFIKDYERLKTFFPQPKGDRWQRTLSLNMVNAGSVFNQIPETAEGVFDIRYTEKDDMEELIEEMRRSVAGDLQPIRKEPVFFSGESSYIEMLLEVSPGSKITFEHGASDARFLSEHGIPGVVWGADGEYSAHSGNEHVVVSSVLDLYERLSVFVDKVQSVSENQKPGSVG